MRESDCSSDVFSSDLLDGINCNGGH